MTDKACDDDNADGGLWNSPASTLAAAVALMVIAVHAVSAAAELLDDVRVTVWRVKKWKERGGGGR